LSLEDWEQVLRASCGSSESAQRQATRVDASAPGNGRRAEAARHPVAIELLETPGALLTRSHLRDLGLERRAVDAVFRALPVVAIPGYSRPMVSADLYRELVERSTYRDDRVRPTARAS
jgi:hypothetical protein